MPDVRVIRLTVLGTLAAHPEVELRRVRRAAAAGDESWHEWLEDHANGRAVIACMQVVVDVGVGNRVERAMSDPTVVWLEVARDLPAVERQLQEFAGKDFAALEALLRSRSIENVTARHMERMFVDVQIDGPLLAAVSSGGGA